MSVARFGHFRRGLALAAAWLALAAAAAEALASVPTSGMERLRHLTRLPQLYFSTGVFFSPSSGLVMITPVRVDPRELEAIRQTLAGNASDAPRYAQLGRLLTELGKRALADRALAQAAEFYSQQSAEESRDASLLIGVGEVLQMRGHADRAERAMRRAVEVAPNDWKSHAALARFLSFEGLHAIVPPQWRSEGGAVVDRMLAEYPRLTPAPAEAERARRLLDEAAKEADRAVALAPEQSEVFATRASVNTCRRFLDALLPMLGKPGGDARKIQQAVFNAASVPDVQAAARLARTNALAWGTAVLYEVLAEGFQRDLNNVSEMMSRDLWSQMPDATRQNVRQAMTRIEELAPGVESRQAATALATLGSLQCFLLRDMAGGETSLRRAIALDPANENAWESLTFALAMSRNFPPMIEVCQSRLKHSDTVRNRVLLAKAFERNNQPEAMLETALEAHAENRDHLLANLAAAAALLKARGDDDVSRSRALQCLIRATQFAGENPPPEVTTELLFQRSLYFALSGQTALARASFGQLLELDPTQSEAQEALKALEQTTE